MGSRWPACSSRCSRGPWCRKGRCVSPGKMRLTDGGCSRRVMMDAAEESPAEGAQEAAMKRAQQD